MRDLTDFFTRHVPEHADDPAFTSLRGLSDVVAITVASPASGEETFRLWFEGGALRQGEPPESATPRTTFRLERPVFEAVVAGQLTPQVAFFTRRLGVHGDILFGLQLGTLLAGFFRRHPWPPVVEHV